jgi:hypothetical protein
MIIELMIVPVETLHVSIFTRLIQKMIDLTFLQTFVDGCGAGKDLPCNISNRILNQILR